MAQLKDDCFAFGGELMPLEEALGILAERVGPVTEPETVALREAAGRVLAEDIVSPRDVPPHDNSAVDGYAVHFEDLDPEVETHLPLGGRVTAGHPLGRPATRGEAIRIFTGAPMPAGPDTVFMEEDCREDDGKVVLPPGLKQGANRRRRGEDIREGDVIVTRGRRLRAQEIGVAASVGRTSVLAHRRLRTAVFSTGDEVRDPADDAPEGTIYDANRYSVMSLLQDLGCAVTDLGILPDRMDAIRDALADAAAEHDLLITSAGVSAGEEDHVKAAVEALGRIDFWRLAIKPGRPIALGQVGGKAFVGLPGNPVAAMVTFMLIARPVILRLQGRSDVFVPRFTVRAGFDMKKKAGRREWARVKLEAGDDGRPVAIKHKSSGAGILTSMVEADGLIELAEDVQGLTAGDSVDFLPFTGVTQ